MISEDRKTPVDAVCRICGRSMLNLRTLARHIMFTHKISRKQYYDRYFRKKEEGKCLTCGNPTQFGKLKYGYNLYCSRICANKGSEKKRHTRKTVRKRFGVDYNLQAKVVKEKARETCLKKYGVRYPAQVPEIIEKARKTMNERYGAWYTKTQVYREKAQTTSLKHYGTISPNQNEEVKCRQLKTLKAHYGENPWRNKRIIEKRKQTTRKRYGCDCFTQTEEYQKKREQTSLARYGHRNHMQNAEIFHKCMLRRKHGLVVDGVFYESEWEYKFAQFLTKQGIKFEYHPGFSLPYKYRNKEHRYYPDFIVETHDGERRIVEVKGDYLAKEMAKKNTKDHAKWQCMLANNVKVLFGQDLINLGITGIKVDKSQATRIALLKLREEL